MYQPVDNMQHVAYTIANIIIAQLAADKNVLWLVPGGSSIAIAALAAQEITVVPHSNLAVTLTDERYGPVGHSDSNWQQLMEIGFSLPDARLFPVLTGADRVRTTTEFDATLQREILAADFTLGFFGMGADGHTAGILPNSPAVSAPDYATVYDAANFERITMTPRAIAQLDEAVVYAVGKDKWPALKQLNEVRDIADQPAQSLKQVPKLTIFTDYTGEAQ
jgi:6-phosphogluconolactonase/glucosamine-6-phosphate isomerase/deaminase